MSDKHDDEDLNQQALDMMYGEPAAETEETEAETEPTEAAAAETPAAEDTSVEDAGDEDETEVVAGAAEATTEETAAATADDPWKARFEELEAQLTAQRELYESALQKNAPPADLELQKLFGPAPETPPAAVQQQAPPAQQQVDQLTAIIAEHVVSDQPLQFFRSEQEVNAFNAGDINAANLILSRVVNTAVDRALRGSAKITAPMVAEQTNRQALISAYFQERPQLAKHRGEIGALVTRYAGLRPDLTLAEIMTVLTPEINKRFGGAPPVKPGKAAAPAAPRGPKTRQQGGRFQPQQPGAKADSSFDLWQQAKAAGDI